eukprot:392094_1
MLIMSHSKPLDHHKVTSGQYANEMYVAEYEQKLVGLAMAIHWGSFRVWSNICVLPEYHQNGIGSMLVAKINDSLQETDKNGAIKRDVLFTSVGTHHIGFYMKLGFLPKYLTYVTTFDILKNYDAAIKNKHDILNAVLENYSFKDVLSEPNDEQLSEFVSSSNALTNEIYKGLDVSVIINGFAKMKNAKIGTCVALYDLEDKDGAMCGFGILAFGESSEAKKDTMKIKFAAAKNYQHLCALIFHIIEYSKQMEIPKVEAGIDMARVNAFSILIEKFGFEYDAKNPKVSMGKT